MLEEPRLLQTLGPYMGKASRVMERHLNQNFALAGFEITLEHWIILVHLWLEDGRNQMTLCNFAGRNKTRITRIIDNLETQNYVVRVPDKNDRRNKLIYLTHKGKHAQKELTELVLKAYDQATQGIPPNEIDICKKVLHQVFLNLADEEHMQQFLFDSYKRNDQT